MKLRDLPRRACEVVLETLAVDEPEVERLLVAGVLIERKGQHYRIEYDSEPWAELEVSPERAAGRCDCGAVLSARGSRLVCRACGREYRET